MVAADVVATSSPSMDVGVSSNFERLLFEATSRDGGACAATMAAFAADGEYRVLPEVHGTITDYFDGVRVSEDEVDEEMAAWHRRGLLVDPHSAIGLRAAEARRVPGVPIVALATAHPAKFPDAVEAATGVRPELPEALADLLERPEHAYAVAIWRRAEPDACARRRWWADAIGWIEPRRSVNGDMELAKTARDEL
jgi:threonine synthase